MGVVIDGEAVVGLRDIEGNTRLYFWITALYRNRGIATTALSFFFNSEYSDCHRVVAWIGHDDTFSQKPLIQAGFQFEATQRETKYGLDICIYSLLISNCKLPAPIYIRGTFAHFSDPSTFEFLTDYLMQIDSSGIILKLEPAGSDWAAHCMLSIEYLHFEKILLYQGLLTHISTLVSFHIVGLRQINL